MRQNYKQCGYFYEWTKSHENAPMWTGTPGAGPPAPAGLAAVGYALVACAPWPGRALWGARPAQATPDEDQAGDEERKRP